MMMLYAVCSFKSNDYYYIILLGQHALGPSGRCRRAPDPPGRRPVQSGSSWAPPIAPLVLSDATQRALGPSGRCPPPPPQRALGS